MDNIITFPEFIYIYNIIKVEFQFIYSNSFNILAKHHISKPNHFFYKQMSKKMANLSHEKKISANPLIAWIWISSFIK